MYPIPPRNEPGKDFYAHWEDFLTPNEITYLLSRPEWENAHPAMVGGQDNKQMLNTDVRRTNVSWIECKPDTQDIWERMTNVIAEVNRRYFRFNLTGCYEPMQIGVYSARDQGHYSWHTDMNMQDHRTPRKLSMALLLNDPSEFEGGELQIKTVDDNAITLELKQGRAWFFPSWVLHRVTPVTRGVRKSLVIWAGGPAFK